jgi:hypothetical protein
MRKMKMMDAEEDKFVVDEKLGTYFECISMWDRKQWLATELHASQDLGIQTIGRWSIE